MTFCHKCGQQLTPSTEKFCPNCGQDLNDRTTSKGSINVNGNKGDIFGIGVSGSGHTIGKNIVVGSGPMNVSRTEIQNIPPEYAKSIEDFSYYFNEQFKGRQIPEDKVKSIKNDLTELGKEVEDVKPGEEDKVNQSKKIQVEVKTTSLIQKILNVLPESAETISCMLPTSPLAKLLVRLYVRLWILFQRNRCTTGD